MKNIEPITDQERDELLLEKLADRPNAISRTGLAGMSPRELKRAFDRPTKFLAAKINEIISEILGIRDKDISSATINTAGNLIITLKDGTVLDAGRARGADGLTPHIGADGHWWIGDVDTGVNASGSGAGGGSGIDIEPIPVSEIDSWFNDAEATTVSFVVDGIAYTVAGGTTWEQFITDDSPEGLYLDDNGYPQGDQGQIFDYTLGEDEGGAPYYVEPTDVIIDGHDYRSLW